MVKIAQIATAVFPVTNALGSISIGRSIAIVDEFGRGFELKDNKWVRLPEVPDLSTEVELDQGISGKLISN